MQLLYEHLTVLIIFLVDLSDASQQRVTLCWDAPNVWSFSIFSCKSNQSPFHIKLEKAKIWYTPNFICHLIYYFPIFSNINHINHTSESYYEQMFASTNIKNIQIRHEICQTFYTSRLLTKNILPESA